MKFLQVSRERVFQQPVYSSYAQRSISYHLVALGAMPLLRLMQRSVFFDQILTRVLDRDL
jgi:hypothetical protein